MEAKELVSYRIRPAARKLMDLHCQQKGLSRSSYISGLIERDLLHQFDSIMKNELTKKGIAA